MKKINYSLNVVRTHHPKREYDHAASEILANAKYWFTKFDCGSTYKLTRWGNTKVKKSNPLTQILNAMYPKSLVAKILELLKRANMCFTTSYVQDATQFKEWWTHYFRKAMAA